MVISSLLDMASMEKATEDPESLFKYLTVTLAVIGVTIKAWPHLKSYTSSSGSDKSEGAKPAEIVSIQWRFLPVFFLLRMSFWMAGPYLYKVYSSKILRHIDGTTSPATDDFFPRVSLVGYLSVVFLGPLVGKLIDRNGPKIASVATGIMYAVGSLSVFSDSTVVLYAGRAVASIASSRLTLAPEAWLISNCQLIRSKLQNGKNWLPEILGKAYGGDALVAILAGQTAGWAASRAGHPTGVFSMSLWFVGAASLLTIVLWGEHKLDEDRVESKGKVNGEGNNKKIDENKDEKVESDAVAESEETKSKESTLKVIFSDPNIVLVGLIQSLFEGSMLMFLLANPPIFIDSIRRAFGPSATTPFGSIFSSFMACFLLGSLSFGQLQKMSVKIEHIMQGILFVSAVAFSWLARTVRTGYLPSAIIASFAFEACVGVYFPSITTLRSQLLPASHRSDIMALFAVSVNALVVCVVLLRPLVGQVGVLAIASLATGIALLCTVLLRWKRREEAKRNWARVGTKVKAFVKMSSRVKAAEDEVVKSRQMLSASQMLSQFIPGSSFSIS